MLIKDIDIDMIELLLHSVPECIECECIMLTNNSYSLKLIAGIEEIKQVKFDDSITELRRVLELQKLKEKNRSKLIDK